MGKIAFIGDKTSIEFFKVFAGDIFIVETVEEAEKVLESISIKDYTIIYITEEVFNEEKFTNYIKDKKLTVIPSIKSNKKIGEKLTKKLIRKATGVLE